MYSVPCLISTATDNHILPDIRSGVKVSRQQVGAIVGALVVPEAHVNYNRLSRLLCLHYTVVDRLHKPCCPRKLSLLTVPQLDNDKLTFKCHTAE